MPGEWAYLRAMGDLPRGTVTFVFTDIEGSTRLLRQLPEHYADVLAEHQPVLRAAFGDGGGARSELRATPRFSLSPADGMQSQPRWQRNEGWPWCAGPKARICGCGWVFIPERLTSESIITSVSTCIVRRGSVRPATVARSSSPGRRASWSPTGSRRALRCAILASTA